MYQIPLQIFAKHLIKIRHYQSVYCFLDIIVVRLDTPHPIKRRDYMPVIILAMHGAPPTDFPSKETIELFNLHARLEHADEQENKTMLERYKHLDAKIRSWPRTPENDPFHAGSVEIADRLREATQQEVIVGFNEFCAPSLDEAFERAMTHSPSKIIVINILREMPIIAIVPTPIKIAIVLITYHSGFFINAKRRITAPTTDKVKDKKESGRIYKNRG